MDHAISRETLYRRFDEIARGKAFGGAWLAHQAVIDRLAENVREAVRRGWTACALERLAGMGRLEGWGVPPGDLSRHSIPDWREERD